MAINEKSRVKMKKKEKKLGIISELAESKVPTDEDILIMAAAETGDATIEAATKKSKEVAKIEKKAGSKKAAKAKKIEAKEPSESSDTKATVAKTKKAKKADKAAVTTTKEQEKPKDIAALETTESKTIGEIHQIELEVGSGSPAIVDVPDDATALGGEAVEDTKEVKLPIKKKNAANKAKKKAAAKKDADIAKTDSTEKGDDIAKDDSTEKDNAAAKIDSPPKDAEPKVEQAVTVPLDRAKEPNETSAAENAPQTDRQAQIAPTPKSNFQQKGSHKNKSGKQSKPQATKPEPVPPVVTIKDYDDAEIKIVTAINGNEILDKPSQKPKRQLHIEPLTDIYKIPQAKALTIENRKDSFVTGFLQEIENFLIKEMYIDRTSKVVVAVSGGVDSMVMLDVMAQLADKYQFTLFIAHYNHNLRGVASQSDLNFVKKVAEVYGLPFYSSSGKVKQYAEKNGISIEAAARFLRYSFFERTSRTLNADFVATAHTADDSAETFLINLLRGTGLTGLSGIPYRRQFVKDVLLIRPFINIKKSTLIKYAKARKIEWQEDETNALQNYTRNKIRLDLLPKLANEYNPAITDVLNRTAKLLQGADRIVHSYVRNNLPNIITDIQTDRFSIKLQLFLTFDKFIQGEMLQSALMKYFRMQAPPMNIIDRIIDLQHSEIGSKCEISKTIFAIKDRNAIVIVRKQFFSEVNAVIDNIGKFKVANFTIILKEINKNQVELGKNPNVEFFDYDRVPPALYIRNWREGDSFQPIGMMGNVKIADFLTNEKVPFVDRQNFLLLSTKNDIIWVLGKRISEKFKIRPETKRFLKVEIRFNGK